MIILECPPPLGSKLAIEYSGCTLSHCTHYQFNLAVPSERAQVFDLFHQNTKTVRALTF
jgi:hypothetical protein